MRASASQVWQIVHAERRRLILDLTGLSVEKWAIPSLCPGWDVRDVVAHLVDTARTGRLLFMRDLIAARMDFDRANERGISQEKRQPPQDTIKALTDVVGLTRTPPVNLVTRLVEAIVHGEDIRRPLGIPGHYPVGAVVQALEYQLRTSVSFGGGRDRVAGLRLVDRGTGAAWGAGDDVTGTAIDLLLAVSGRRVEREALQGSGAFRLAAAASPSAGPSTGDQ